MDWARIVAGVGAVPAATAGAAGHLELHHIEQRLLEQLIVRPARALAWSRAIYQLVRGGMLLLRLLMVGGAAILYHLEQVVVSAIGSNPPITLADG